MSGTGRWSSPRTAVAWPRRAESKPEGTGVVAVGVQYSDGRPAESRINSPAPAGGVGDAASCCRAVQVVHGRAPVAPPRHPRPAGMVRTLPICARAAGRDNQATSRAPGRGSRRCRLSRQCSGRRRRLGATWREQDRAGDAVVPGTSPRTPRHASVGRDERRHALGAGPLPSCAPPCASGQRSDERLEDAGPVPVTWKRGTVLPCRRALVYPRSRPPAAGSRNLAHHLRDVRPSGRRSRPRRSRATKSPRPRALRQSRPMSAKSAAGTSLDRPGARASGVETMPRRRCSWASRRGTARQTTRTPGRRTRPARSRLARRAARRPAARKALAWWRPGPQTRAGMQRHG